MRNRANCNGPHHIMHEKNVTKDCLPIESNRVCNDEDKRARHCNAAIFHRFAVHSDRLFGEYRSIDTQSGPPIRDSKGIRTSVAS